VNSSIQILETPRDAMQGLHRIIPTDKKVELINAILKVGFDIVDIGSFVSPKAVPQMSDTADVLEQIDAEGSKSNLFVLAVNVKGAVAASKYTQISYIGFPFSTSPTFLKKNINSDLAKAWKTVNDIQDTCVKANKNLLVYLSMAFGNPYNDPDDVELIFQWVEKFHKLGIKNISLSDITGVASVEKIKIIYTYLTNLFPTIEFGIHLHTRSNDWYNKIDTAYRTGCILFEGVINGLGGCPMTGYEKLGNLSTGKIMEWASKNAISFNAEFHQYKIAFDIANKILL
jgi:hydroxymethylglutaryl-CoA lyase